MSTSDDLVPLPGTSPAPIASSRALGPADPDEMITVTITLRPRDPMPTDAQIEAMALRPIADREPISRESFATSYGADPSAMAEVEAYARRNHLRVVDADAGSRLVVLSGRVADFASAFGVTLSRFEKAGRRYRGVTSSIRVPSPLAPSIESVLGLDDAPAARPHG